MPYRPNAMQYTRDGAYFENNLVDIQGEYIFIIESMVYIQTGSINISCISITFVPVKPVTT